MKSVYQQYTVLITYATITRPSKKIQLQNKAKSAFSWAKRTLPLVNGRVQLFPIVSLAPIRPDLAAHFYYNPRVRNALHCHRANRAAGPDKRTARAQCAITIYIRNRSAARRIFPPRAEGERTQS